MPPPVREEDDPNEDEINSLLQSVRAHPNDPLAMMENFQDEFDDEMDEIEMQQQQETQQQRTRHQTNASPRKVINLNAVLAEQKILKQKRKRRRRCYFCLSILFLLGAIAAGLVALFGFGNKNNSSSSSSTVSHHNRQQAVPQAPSVLKLWCAENYDLPPGQNEFGTGIPKDCETACLKAECSWNPNTIYHCTEETKQECEGYKHPCSIMLPEHISHDTSSDDSQMVVPEAPATLKTTCVIIGDNFKVTKVCNDHCQLGSCCWQTNPTRQCTKDSKEQCAPYEEFCSFLNNHPYRDDDNNDDTSSNGDLPFPVAPDNLKTLCSADNSDRTQCQSSCSKADCCWKVGTVNCASTAPNQMCQDYSPCEILNKDNLPTASATPSPSTAVSASVTLPFPEAPNDLQVYCNVSEMEEISLSICHDRCTPAECCWNTEKGPCPASVPDDACQPYIKSCAILNNFQTRPGTNDDEQGEEETGSVALGGGGGGTADTVPVAPSDLAQRCSHDQIVASSNAGSTLVGCERDCLAAACCWKTDVESCEATNDLCTAYKGPCSMFLGLFDLNGVSSSSPANTVTASTAPVPIVPEAPSTIKIVCSPDVLKADVNNGKFIVECEKECLAGACCWKDNHSTKCEGVSQCSGYMEPCGDHLVNALVLLQGTSAGGGGDDDETIDDELVQQKEIKTACNNQVAFFQQSRCETACAPGSCCFKDTETCALGIDCDIYEPCQALENRNRRQLRH